MGPLCRGEGINPRSNPYPETQNVHSFASVSCFASPFISSLFGFERFQDSLFSRIQSLICISQMRSHQVPIVVRFGNNFRHYPMNILTKSRIPKWNSIENPIRFKDLMVKSCSCPPWYENCSVMPAIAPFHLEALLCSWKEVEDGTTPREKKSQTNLGRPNTRQGGEQAKNQEIKSQDTRR